MKPKLLQIIKHRDQELKNGQIFKDVIAGIIVAIIALPLSIALAISSGVAPEKGLITAIIAGFFISFLGGSRVQIGGPTAAFVVIIFGIIQKHGLDGLIMATIMAGILLVIFGICKFGSLIKYIPYPITVGFTTGIAITLFTTQVKDFLGLQIDKVPSEFLPKWASYFAHLNTINYMAFLLGAIALIIMIVWPKINKMIPGSLVALIVITLAAYLFKLNVPTIGSTFGEISSKISGITVPKVDLETVIKLIKPAFTIAILASIESLLSAVVADGMIGKKHNSNMELIGQGVANIASGLFGGIPATGAIARTAANVKNGGRTPIAGITHAVTLFLIMIIFMPLAKYIPLTVLAAILMIVSYNMSELKVFKAMLKGPKSDVIILITTCLLTVIFDLVVAIEIGMVIAMFLFMRRMANNLEVNMMDSDECAEFTELNGIDTSNIGKGIVVYEIEGALFFGAVDTFMDAIKKIDSESSVLILRMRHVSMLDATGYKVLKNIEEKCNKDNIKLVMSGVNDQPYKVMKNMGMVKRLGKERFNRKFKDAVILSNRLISE
ncbi:SulP family inorganic anion transporter [Inconstantimicrobium porci]|uniref:STAS domain-containing protein n=1 Tax=Inconstantimicrobium porci TaxID=2652291 RepID=A0A7X2MWV7_9CLOT|nr:SulP family inorganic anion transporter [Inconstantimicrobium porci]MSR90568.1 STAS domain-containing protein [Inconstantimicrobium porci]